MLVSPRVVFVSDATMGRRHARRRARHRASAAGAASATGAIIMPPTEIGAEAVVGAAAVVKADVAPRTVVAGVPARVLREVRDDELLEAWL